MWCTTNGNTIKTYIGAFTKINLSFKWLLQQLRTLSIISRFKGNASFLKRASAQLSSAYHMCVWFFFFVITQPAARPTTNELKLKIFLNHCMAIEQCEHNKLNRIYTYSSVQPDNKHFISRHILVPLFYLINIL